MNPLSTSPSSLSTVRLLAHADGLVLTTAAIVAYSVNGGSWIFFAVLLFAPDLFMLGYTANPRIGSLIYNAGHTVAIPAALIAAGLLAAIPILVSLGLIWLTHIEVDHVFGYGYKYPTAFKDTHFDRL